MLKSILGTNTICQCTVAQIYQVTPECSARESCDNIGLFLSPHGSCICLTGVTALSSQILFLCFLGFCFPSGHDTFSVPIGHYFPIFGAEPVLNWANVCSPKILRTLRRTMIRFLIELLVRRIWFGQSKLYFILNWLIMRCKLWPELAADAQQTA